MRSSPTMPGCADRLNRISASLLVAGVFSVVAPSLAQAQYFWPYRGEVVRRGYYEEDYAPRAPRGIAPRQVVSILSAQGYRQIGRPVQDGDVYRLEATDEDGNRVRVLVDAYIGDILEGRVLRRAERQAPREAALQERRLAPPPAPRRLTPLPPASAVPLPPEAELPKREPPVAAAPTPEERHETIRRMPDVKDEAKALPPPPPAAALPEPGRPVPKPAEPPVAAIPPAQEPARTEPLRDEPPKAWPSIKDSEKAAIAPVITPRPDAEKPAAARSEPPVAAIPQAAPKPPPVKPPPAMKETAKAVPPRPAPPQIRGATPKQSPAPKPQDETAVIVAPNNGLGTGTAAAPRKIEMTPPALLDDAPQRKDTAPINAVPPAPLD